MTTELVDAETGEIVSLDVAAAERRAQQIEARLAAVGESFTIAMRKIREAIENRDDVALGYRSPGDYVSARFGSALSGLPVEMRREAVRELTEAGMSTRAIAPVVGTSQKTIVKDRQVIPQVSPAPEPSADAAPAAPAETAGPAPEDVEPEVADSDDDAAPAQPEAGSASTAPSPRTVTGVDGKTYSVRAPQPPQPCRDERIAAAVAEFPDLAYYRDRNAAHDHDRLLATAEQLREFIARGQGPDRLENLRRSIAAERRRDESGPRLTPVPSPPTSPTCPTCGQTVKD